MSAVAQHLPFRDRVALAVERRLSHAQVECPLTHRFAPGVYLREIFMPAGTEVIGKVHRTEHFNVILRGSVEIFHEDGTSEVLTAPHTFVSKPGVQKVLLILEDTVWQTIHPTDETDVPALEAVLVDDRHPEVTDETRAECERIAAERSLCRLSQQQ